MHTSSQIFHIFCSPFFLVRYTHSHTHTHMHTHGKLVNKQRQNIVAIIGGDGHFIPILDVAFTEHSITRMIENEGKEKKIL